MRRVLAFFAALVVTASLRAAAAPALPITFEEQDGGFLSRGPGYQLWLARHAVTLASRDGRVVRIALAGARDEAPAGVELLQARSNYLVGSDPARWRVGVANYEKVEYAHVYPGINLVWHGNGNQVEHDFVLAPGADADRIRLVFRGAAVGLTPEGDLSAGSFLFHKPRAWQDGREVDCRYENRGEIVRFRLGPYNHARPLTIDPVLSLSTLFGGNGGDSATAIALDRAGNIYVAGNTNSADLPTTSGVIQPNFPGLCPGIFGGSFPCPDIFVAKLSSDGSKLLYSTYLGDKYAQVFALAVDATGSVYLAGQAGSGVPKLMPLPGQTLPPNASFVAKLSIDGSSVIYATALPPTVYATALAVDRTGSLYLTGSASGGWLPVVNAFQPASGYAMLFKTGDGGNHWQGFASGLPQDLAGFIRVDPTNPQVLYASFTYNDSLYKSTDGGSHWSNISGGLPVRTLPTVLVVDPHAPQTIYLGTGNDTLQSIAIYKSTDGGTNWTPSATGISGNNFLSDLALDPNSSGTLYAATSTGVLKSVDGAASWNPTGLAVRAFRIVLDPSQPGALYAGTGNGLMKSTDGGVTWTLTNPNIVEFAIDPTNSQTLYGAVVGYQGVFKSQDGGAHWNLARWVFPYTFVESLLVDPTLHTRIWAGTNNGLLVSVDSGVTWTPTPIPFPHMSNPGLAADGQGNLFVLGSGWLLPDAFAMKLDPSGSQVVYSTYLGGFGGDYGTGIAVDAAGRAYISGRTDSPDFPVAAAVQTRIGGDYDAFVTVLDPSGTRLAWSTYFGGMDADAAAGVALDNAGNVHLGITSGTSVLVDPNGISAIAAKFKGDGSAVLYSTKLSGAGDTMASGVATDAAGNTYIAGTTTAADFPVINALQGSLAGASDAFVAAVDGKTGAVQYATYLGGSGTDTAKAMASDGAGNVYIAGQAGSSDFPQAYPLQTFGACPPGSTGCSATHAFIAKLAAPANGPVTRVDAVTDAARYGATLAPGELATIWGGDLALTPASSGRPPLALQLSDVKVTVNGVPAPLVYAAGSQINIQIPFETQPGAAQVQVTSTAGTATHPVQIAAAAPAIFSQNASGTGPGAIQHAGTYAIVSDASPAAGGETILIYGTGLGAVSPAAQTGAPAPPSQTTTPVNVFIGGTAAQVLYAGLAPGYAGLYQINAQIPAGTPPGAQPVQITMSGGAASNTVTISIR
ncbi:MAG TPA: SBBP repeat-containing protein [Bryobacteraceae bacterium]|nr:SBBP repeat-containing protein [Bryobacteraceae bacterium]